jgi:hypothetical protein
MCTKVLGLNVVPEDGRRLSPESLINKKYGGLTIASNPE